jgi:hypothetical protein
VHHQDRQQKPTAEHGAWRAGLFHGPRGGWLDASQLSQDELDQVAAGTPLRRLEPVWVRRGKDCWWPVTMTGMCRLGPGEWAIRVQAGPDSEPVWLRYCGASIQPILPLEGLPPGELTELSRRGTR